MEYVFMSTCCVYVNLFNSIYANHKFSKAFLERMSIILI